jgi:hypothetical protein
VIALLALGACTSFDTWCEENGCPTVAELEANDDACLVSVHGVCADGTETYACGMGFVAFVWYVQDDEVVGFRYVDDEMHHESHGQTRCPEPTTVVD